MFDDLLPAPPIASGTCYRVLVLKAENMSFDIVHGQLADHSYISGVHLHLSRYIFHTAIPL